MPPLFLLLAEWRSARVRAAGRPWAGQGDKEMLEAPPADERPSSNLVTLSGEPLELKPPAGEPGERVRDLRERLAKALAMDPERLLLVAGSRMLQNGTEVAEVLRESQEAPLTVLISEDLMDTDDPQHVAEYASEIYRRLLAQDRTSGRLAGLPAPAAAASGEASPEATSATAMQLSTPEAAAQASSPLGPDSRALGPSGASGVRAAELLTPPKRLRGELVDRTSRCVLMDWLVEEHQGLQLRAETLFLAVRLIDRFLLRRRVATRDLRLVGAAGLLIAAKFEEIYPPEIRDLVYITNNEYSVDDLKRMEVLILSVLEFSIAGETAAHFMDRYLRANQCQELEGRLVGYLLELTLVDEAAIQRSPSVLAAAAVLLVNRLSGRLPAWPAVMVNYTEQTEEALQPAAGELLRLLREARTGAFTRVRNKLLKDEPLLTFVKTIEATAE